MKNFNIFTLILFVFSFLILKPVNAEDFSIVAKVNEDIITAFDLNSRIKLIMSGANIEDIPENRKKLSPQVIKILIDEKLKQQEAKRLGLEVADEELQSAFEHIESNNKMEPGALKEALKQDGINFLTLEDQIKIQLLWLKVMEKTVKPTISISEKEIDEELEKIKASVGKPEYLISEIFLAVNNDNEKEAVKQDMEKIRQIIIDKQAPFEAVANQFSNSNTAAKGGVLGYVDINSLDKELADAVITSEQGTLLGPIKTSSGYYLLLVKDKRVLTQEQVPDRIQIRSKIGNKRLAIREKNALNSLRRKAVIDIVN